jgi:hypothetical protein
MAKPLPEAERWEDPIVAEVRKAREKLFAAAGYDLEALCKRLNEQQQREGRRTVTHPPRMPKRGRAKPVPRPNESMHRTRGKDVHR